MAQTLMITDIISNSKGLTPNNTVLRLLFMLHYSLFKIRRMKLPYWSYVPRHKNVTTGYLGSCLISLCVKNILILHVCATKFNENIIVVIPEI